MSWTKKEIITEVCEYMDFTPLGNGLYKDNQGCWEDHDIETLIFEEVDNMDNYFVYDEENPSEEDKKQAKWVLDFCESAKKIFNMKDCLDYFIEEYKGIVYAGKGE